MDITIAPQDNPSNNVPNPFGGNGEAANDQRTPGGLSTASSYSQLNAVTDPATELTEDDIFCMKKLRLESSNDQQSAISVVDSSSNFDEHVPDAQDGDFGSAEEEAEVVTKEDRPGHKVIIQEDYVFGRERPSSPELNRQTVTVLNYPFEPILYPPGENEEEYKAFFASGKVFLIGTAHFSPESQQDVIQTIAKTTPDVVMVELCSSRISILSMDEETLLREARSLNRDKILALIRQNGVIQGILHVLLLSTTAHITRQLGMAPGGEFRAAHQAAAKLPNCRIVLGDRPIQVTLQRALAALGFFQKCRLFFHILMTNNTSITQDDVERCKNKDLLEELLREMAGEFPQLSKIFVEERDRYMTHVLHSLLQKATMEKYNACRRAKVKYEPVHVVAVVGIGHVSGIVSHWNKQIDASELLTIPEPSRTSKVVRFGFRCAVLGVAAYATYRFGRFTIDFVRDAF